MAIDTRAGADDRDRGGDVPRHTRDDRVRVLSLRLLRRSRGDLESADGIREARARRATCRCTGAVRRRLDHHDECHADGRVGGVRVWHRLQRRFLGSESVAHPGDDRASTRLHASAGRRDQRVSLDRRRAREVRGRRFRAPAPVTCRARVARRVRRPSAALRRCARSRLVGLRAA